MHHVVDLHTFLLRVYVRARTVQLTRESGQTVAEYAVVLLVAAAIAVGFLIWARQTGKLNSFFDSIFNKLVNSVDSAPTPTPGP
jgi:Flp pilus assembly pilin Flp